MRRINKIDYLDSFKKQKSKISWLYINHKDILMRSIDTLKSLIDLVNIEAFNSTPCKNLEHNIYLSNSTNDDIVYIYHRLNYDYIFD